MGYVYDGLGNWTPSQVGMNYMARDLERRLLNVVDELEKANKKLAAALGENKVLHEIIKERDGIRGKIMGEAERLRGNLETLQSKLIGL
jgi:hypothetical protein